MNGVFPNYPEKKYFSESKKPFSEQHISRSELLRFAEDPEGFQDSPNFESSAKVLGSAFDNIVLRGHEIGKEIVLGEQMSKDVSEAIEHLKKNKRLVYSINHDNFKTKAARVERDHALENNLIPILSKNVSAATKYITLQEQGILMIDKESLGALEKMKKRWDNHPSIQMIMHGAETQVAVYGEHLGVKCRTMLDIVPSKDGPYGDALADLKTTNTTNKFGFRSKCYSFGYHVQAALSLSLYNQQTGEKRNRWLVPAVKNEPGYRAVVFEFEDLIDHGMERLNDIIISYRECLKNGFKEPTAKNFILL